MRTTIDLPDSLFRQTKSEAALRGSTMKDLIVRAIQNEVGGRMPVSERVAKPIELPVIHLPKGKTLDLSNFNFDDLLA